LEKFVDRKDVRNVLDLHTPGGDEPYYLGFFLVGAYQESLSNEHNLFGAINEAEIVMDDEGNWEVTKVTKGDPIEELLVSRNYDSTQMVESYDRQIEASLKAGRIKPEEVAQVRERLHFFMGASPYLAE
jgi:arginine decarboxylase